MKRRPSHSAYIMASAFMRLFISRTRLASELETAVNSPTPSTTAVSTMIRLVILTALSLVHVSSAAAVPKIQAPEMLPLSPVMENPPCIPMRDSRLNLCAGDYIAMRADHGGDKVYAEAGGCFNGDANDCYYQVRGNKNPTNITDAMKFQVFPISRNLEPPPVTAPIFWNADNSWVVYLRDYRGLWLQSAPQTIQWGKKPKHNFEFMAASKFQSRLSPMAEKFILVRPDYPLNVFYLLRPHDGSLFWQFGSDKAGDLFLFDRPYMPTSDKINMALVQIDMVGIPAAGLNYRESFTDYIMNTESGRRELKPLDIVMSGSAENLSPAAQSVSVSWSHSVSSSTNWNIQHSQSITTSLGLTLGVPAWPGTSTSLKNDVSQSYSFSNGGGGGNTTTINVQDSVNVPPYSVMYGWVAAQQGSLEGVEFRIKYNRDFSQNPPFAVSYWLNGTWDVLAYLDMRVCWSPVQSIFNATSAVGAGCTLPSVGSLDESWTRLPLNKEKPEMNTITSVNESKATMVPSALSGTQSEGASSQIAVDKSEVQADTKVNADADADADEHGVAVATQATDGMDDATKVAPDGHDVRCGCGSKSDKDA
ncbi:hypothetical protein SeMB42_g07926 [Synchytrium endobioticum]|uniref:Uncharacterized protein n=1 Tax=Synchytrium endobioticum TaxID=286115 RepID=A0A507CDG5_9FUNG|nr:hypothetical protein SeMB42_g07926 [Synchytrium endobioticum]TPX36086.1 hypothetical protein SeLEV6574_g08101 [Synchytrium endobioticum]